jgi:hypothetical protein
MQEDEFKKFTVYISAVLLISISMVSIIIFSACEYIPILEKEAQETADILKYIESYDHEE